MHGACTWVHMGACTGGYIWVQIASIMANLDNTGRKALIIQGTLARPVNSGNSGHFGHFSGIWSILAHFG